MSPLRGLMFLFTDCYNHDVPTALFFNPKDITKALFFNPKDITKALFFNPKDITKAFFSVPEGRHDCNK